MFSEDGKQYGDLQNLLPIFANIDVQHSLKFPEPTKLFIFRFFNSTLMLEESREVGLLRRAAGRGQPAGGGEFPGGQLGARAASRDCDAGASSPRPSPPRGRQLLSFICSVFIFSCFF